MTENNYANQKQLCSRSAGRTGRGRSCMERQGGMEEEGEMEEEGVKERKGGKKGRNRKI